MQSLQPRVLEIKTPHGVIETPAFIPVGTKATVKSLTPEQIKSLGAQAVLANTYHLMLQPGSELVKKAGGLHQFMNWDGPIFTDSGGFQVLSLGAGYETGLNKFVSAAELDNFHRFTLKGSDASKNSRVQPAVVTEDGVTFRSPIDGQEHFLTPEDSIRIQHDLGADIIFAFDECTSPLHDYQYQKEAMERTHRWAERCLKKHGELGGNQLLFGVVQGGSYRDLREESARVIGSMGFDGFGIGGSYTKEEMPEVVSWVTKLLPEDKPRHLLGIGEPLDFFAGVEAGVDTFDCVTPTRMARNGAFQTRDGRINILNAQCREDLSPIESDCDCYTCKNFSKAYLAHLFRANEMLAATLATIHNLYFSVNLVKSIRQAIIDGNYPEFKGIFARRYRSR